MKFNKTIDNEIKKLILSNSGEIVSESEEILECQIAWDVKENQTRDSDLDRGHIAQLLMDIKSRGLKNKPIVEFDSVSGLYKIVSGHHRCSALRRMVEESEQALKIPVSIVKFKTDVDRQFFMQSENHHPPVKAHTKKDAIRFIKNMRNSGWFDSASGDVNTLQSMTFSLLEKFYCRLNSKSKLEVFHDSFKDREITRILTILKPDVKNLAKKHYGDAKLFQWSNDEYICWGDTNSARKAIAVALEKRVHDLENGVAKFGTKGKIRVVTHFSSTNVSDLKDARDSFLLTEQLMNKHCWSSSCIKIDEVAFIPQIEGKKGIKEKNMIVYRWNANSEEFELLD